MLRVVRLIFRSSFAEECRILSNNMSSGLFGVDNKKYKKKLHPKSEILQQNKSKFEDTFGDIDKYERIFQSTKEDPEDVLQYERERAAQGKTIFEYLNEIKSHLRNHDYKSALRVLEVDMVNDRKPAHQFIYRVLINYNALAGDLKEAYRLFLRYKERQGIVNGALYTSMFNACANCKNSFLAIEKAKAIRECMNKNKHHAANISNYNVMLKAFGRHGDIITCFQIIDEVLEKKDKVRSETYVFLLQACASDSNSGLRFALLAWRKMLQNKVKPNIFCFNIMLRCVRDCSLGDALLIPELMKEIIEESNVFYRRKVKIKTIGNETKRTVMKILTDESGMIAPALVNSTKKTSSESSSLEEMKATNSHQTNNNESTSDALSDIRLPESVPEAEAQPGGVKLPNFLKLNPSCGSVVELGVLTEPHHRLILVGGVKGFLETMAEFDVKPDIKTFTLLLQIIPSTPEAEEELMSLVAAHKIQFDVNFFNVLAKKRIFRGELNSIKECLDQMLIYNIQPDIYTFGILALTCETYESGKEFLDLIQNQGFSLNPPIVNTLLKQALHSKNVKYILDVVRAAREDGTRLDSRFVSMLSDFVEKGKRQKRENPDEDEKILEGYSNFEKQES